MVVIYKEPASQYYWANFKVISIITVYIGISF